MRVIGFDPGIGRLGFAVIETAPSLTLVRAGVITSPIRAPLPLRLHTLATDISSLLKSEQPEKAVVEELFFGRNITTAMAVSHSRGVLLAALFEKGISIHEIHPTTVKKVVAGRGNATKAEVARATCRLLGIQKPPTPDDAADAAAIAISGF